MTWVTRKSGARAAVGMALASATVMAPAAPPAAAAAVADCKWLPPARTAAPVASAARRLIVKGSVRDAADAAGAGSASAVMRCLACPADVRADLHEGQACWNGLETLRGRPHMPGCMLQNRIGVKVQKTICACFALRRHFQESTLMHAPNHFSPFRSTQTAALLHSRGHVQVGPLVRSVLLAAQGLPSTDRLNTALACTAHCQAPCHTTDHKPLSKFTCRCAICGVALECNNLRLNCTSVCTGIKSLRQPSIIAATRKVSTRSDCKGAFRTLIFRCCEHGCLPTCIAAERHHVQAQNAQGMNDAGRQRSKAMGTKPCASSNKAHLLGCAAAAGCCWVAPVARTVRAKQGRLSADDSEARTLVKLCLHQASPTLPDDICPCGRTRTCGSGVMSSPCLGRGAAPPAASPSSPAAAAAARQRMKAPTQMRSFKRLSWLPPSIWRLWTAPAGGR